MTDRHQTALNDDAATFVELLHRLMRALRRESADGSLTPGQARLLRVIHRAGTPLRAVDLANALDVAPRSVTTKVDQAEADGHVRRLPDPTDRRARLVELTDAGVEALHEQWVGRRPGAAARLQRLTPEERTELLRLLTKLTSGG
ncbi:transcriptional regulator, MarR family [Xylanimonas cellulosilytica DSM 15894]|uniref:Transcriptional regulator, MarR family n=1 Tax=Xylanimonas cellulosilytica (strain DSM 15894 / JCM 12276 / CECT 5975 / KCTC 9989 / LMG 20990 / NBRC 107835 / XIL07) TaxID=446471 RepID=D1BS57_XYLCX|nr:MarR family transcriptional regulator [Xylanimonas cellulosilytica]ACZ30549.1 transcriptional regulator, MarR family [Xylanimonas cellulosilytica DSM 15894]